jgi:LacI family transcriptional regulator, galactose operon repressor
LVKAADNSKRRRRDPSMHDVARAAGVSIASVSHALNNPSRLSENTRERIRAAIDELGFVVNSAARSVKAAGRGTGLGIVIGDLQHSFSVEVVKGAQSQARDEKVTLLIGNGNADVQEQGRYVEMFDQARMEGVLLNVMENASIHLERLRAHGRAVVVINYRAEQFDHCRVLIDNEQVGYDAVKHLAALGSRTFLWLTGSAGWQPLVERRAGIDRAIREIDGATLQETTSPGLLYEDGRMHARTLLQRWPRTPRIDGVVSGTALIARGFIDELSDSGAVRVPEDIRLVSTDEDWLADRGAVTLSVFRPPAERAGREAVRLALAEAADGDRHTHRTVVLTADLVPGTSSLGDR